MPIEDARLLKFYMENISKVIPGLRYKAHNVRVGTKTIDMLCEDKFNHPVIVQIQRGRATLKTIKRVRQYQFAYAQEKGVWPKAVIIATGWSLVAAEDAKMYDIQLVRHPEEARPLLKWFWRKARAQDSDYAR